MQKEEAAGSSRFSAQEKTDYLVASRNRWLEHEGKRVALQENVAMRVARRKPRRNSGKGASVPRKKDEDAAAAAEFLVNK